MWAQAEEEYKKAMGLVVGRVAVANTAWVGGWQRVSCQNREDNVRFWSARERDVTAAAVGPQIACARLRGVYIAH